jgi:glycosyltransferase involved in cell wall biosynthesis
VKVSIVIPNWSGQHWLETCFESLRRQTYKDFEIIMVDNGSTDDSVSFTLAASRKG